MAAAPAEAVARRRPARLRCRLRLAAVAAAAATRRLVFIGDISAVANRTAPVIDERLKALIASADLVVGNCESPVVERRAQPARHRGRHAPRDDRRVPVRHARRGGHRAQAAACFRSPTITCSTRASTVLPRRGRRSPRWASQPSATAEDGLIRTVDLGGSQPRPSPPSPNGAMPAGSDFAGRVTMLDDLARDDFAALRKAEADLVCVVAHWDWEFRHIPRPATRALAQPPRRQRRGADRRRPRPCAAAGRADRRRRWSPMGSAISWARRCRTCHGPGGSARCSPSTSAPSRRPEAASPPTSLCRSSG